MTEEELAARRPVWDALSELFLDTEVRVSVPWVATACARSPYGLEVLDGIFWREVFPLAIDNLLQVAGEWAGLALDEGALVRRAEGAAGPSPRRFLSGWMVEAEWRAVQALVARLREEPPGRWPPLQRFWGLCCRQYLDLPAAGPRPAELEGLEGLDLLMEWRAFEPVARGMLLKGERETAAARAAAVEAVLGGLR